MVRTKCTSVANSFSLYSEKMATKCPTRRSRRLHGKTWVSLMYGFYLKYIKEKRDLINWPMKVKAEWKAKDEAVFDCIVMNQVRHLVSWNKLIKKGIIKNK